MASSLSWIAHVGALAAAAAPAGPAQVGDAYLPPAVRKEDEGTSINWAELVVGALVGAVASVLLGRLLR